MPTVTRSSYATWLRLPETPVGQFFFLWLPIAQFLWAHLRESIHGTRVHPVLFCFSITFSMCTAIAPGYRAVIAARYLPTEKKMLTKFNSRYRQLHRYQTVPSLDY